MRKLHILLIIVILIGIGARLYKLDANYLNGDEEFYIVAAEKFHAGSDYDVRIWNYHAPPVAKYIMSLPLAFTQADYSIPYAIPPNLWVWNYVAFESIKQVYTLIRTVTALFGILFIVFIFLIGRELFGRTAGLWAAASAAIAIDYIILSRVALVDMFLYAFIASTMFFYIKYRKAAKPLPWLIGLFFSLILMFGTKNAQWIVVIPPLLYVEIVGNKKHIMKTIHFLVILGIAWFIHSSFIYPPAFSKPAYEFFTMGANKNFIEPYADIVVKSILTINSYFFLAVFALTIGFYLRALGILKKSLYWGKIKNHLAHPSPYTFVIFIAILSLLTFSLTSLSQNSKYVGQISIPFFVLGGFVVTKVWNRYKIAKGVLLLLLLIGVFSAIWYFPSYEEYPGQQVISIANPGSLVNPLLDFLHKQGNPPVITNEMNLLLFYTGQAFPIPVKDSQACTQQLTDTLKTGGVIGIFKNVGSVERGFLCDRIFNYTQELTIAEKSIGNVKAVKY